jgi:hypothetical protein
LGWWGLITNLRIEGDNSQVYLLMQQRDFLAYIMLKRAELSPREWAVFQDRIGCNLAHPSTYLQGDDALDTTRLLTKKPFTSARISNVTMIDDPQFGEPSGTINPNQLFPCADQIAGADETPSYVGRHLVKFDVTYTIPVSLPIPMDRCFGKYGTFPFNPLGGLIFTINFDPAAEKFYNHPTFYDVHLNTEGITSQASDVGIRTRNEQSYVPGPNPFGDWNIDQTVAPTLEFENRAAPTSTCDKFIIPRTRIDPFLMAEASTLTMRAQAQLPGGTQSGVASKRADFITRDQILGVTPAPVLVPDEFLPNVLIFNESNSILRPLFSYSLFILLLNRAVLFAPFLCLIVSIFSIKSS